MEAALSILSSFGPELSQATVNTKIIDLDAYIRSDTIFEVLNIVSVSIFAIRRDVCINIRVILEAFLLITFFIGGCQFFAHVCPEFINL